MNITIKLIYLSHGIRVMRGCSFKVKDKQYKVDPEVAAAHAAFNWIKEIKREMNVDEVIEVVFNGDKNITEKVLSVYNHALDRDKMDSNHI